MCVIEPSVGKCYEKLTELNRVTILQRCKKKQQIYLQKLINLVPMYCVSRVSYKKKEIYIFTFRTQNTRKYLRQLVNPRVTPSVLMKLFFVKNCVINYCQRPTVSCT